MEITNLSIDDLENMNGPKIKNIIYDMLSVAKSKQEKSKFLFSQMSQITYHGTYGLIHSDMSDLEEPQIIGKFDNCEIRVTYIGGEKPYQIQVISSGSTFNVVDFTAWMNKGGIDEANNY